MSLLLVSETERGSGATSIRFKVECDARLALTVTDTAAQRIVCLRGEHLGLNIIEEEDKSVGVVEDGASMVEIRVKGNPLGGCDWDTPSLCPPLHRN